MRADGWSIPAWHRHGACVGVEPSVFFDVLHLNVALEICGRCPVQLQCLQQALQDPFSEGVWGGTTDAKRRSIRRRAAKYRKRKEDNFINNHNPTEGDHDERQHQRPLGSPPAGPPPGRRAAAVWRWVR